MTFERPYQRYLQKSRSKHHFSQKNSSIYQCSVDIWSARIVAFVSRSSFRPLVRELKIGGKTWAVPLHTYDSLPDDLLKTRFDSLFIGNQLIGWPR